MVCEPSLFATEVEAKLYAAPLRDLLLQLAVSDLFRARWPAEIHQEWIDALLRNEPYRERATLERTRDLIDRAKRDSLVAGYERLIPSLVLPDDGDRHVLATAIAGRCDVIVTRKLIDFPLAVLRVRACAGTIEEASFFA